MSLVLCPQVASQAPQHFRSSEKQAASEGCFCPPIYLIGHFLSLLILMNLIKTTEVAAREPLTTTTTHPNVEMPQHGVRTYDNDRLAGICYCECAMHAECMISTAYRARSVLGGACQLIAIVASDSGLCFSLLCVVFVVRTRSRRLPSYVIYNNNHVNL